MHVHTWHFNGCFPGHHRLACSPRFSVSIGYLVIMCRAGCKSLFSRSLYWYLSWAFSQGSRPSVCIPSDVVTPCQLSSLSIHWHLTPVCVIFIRCSDRIRATGKFWTSLHTLRACGCSILNCQLDIVMCIFDCVLFRCSPVKADFIRAKYQFLAFVNKHKDAEVTLEDINKVCMSACIFGLLS